MLYLNNFTQEGKAMTPEERAALKELIEYTRDDELRDYEAQDCPASHIYNSIQKLQKFLDRSQP
jgi:hypothetical protein